MTDYVEGFPVLPPGHPDLHTWNLPDKDGRVIRRITLRNGSVGLVLVWIALRFHELIERLDINPGVIDEGGHSYRRITGGSGWSKHATGAAEDLNWQRHPYGTRATATFTDAQIKLIRRDLRRCLGVVEWGGNWPSHPGSTASPDPMHWQIHSSKRMSAVERLAKILIRTPRGRRILKANPGQREVIYS